MLDGEVLSPVAFSVVLVGAVRSESELGFVVSSASSGRGESRLLDSLGTCREVCFFLLRRRWDTREDTDSSSELRFEGVGLVGADVGSVFSTGPGAAANDVGAAFDAAGGSAGSDVGAAFEAGGALEAPDAGAAEGGSAGLDVGAVFEAGGALEAPDAGAAEGGSAGLDVGAVFEAGGALEAPDAGAAEDAEGGSAGLDVGAVFEAGGALEAPDVGAAEGGTAGADVGAVLDAAGKSVVGSFLFFRRPIFTLTNKKRTSLHFQQENTMESINHQRSLLTTVNQDSQQILMFVDEFRSSHARRQWSLDVYPIEETGSDL
jgi:hypothetical protein